MIMTLPISIVSKRLLLRELHVINIEKLLSHVPKYITH